VSEKSGGESQAPLPPDRKLTIAEVRLLIFEVTHPRANPPQQSKIKNHQSAINCPISHDDRAAGEKKIDDC
jgi:hypothetical protein